MNNFAIPALSENRTARFTLVSAMYFAQGIEMGLFMVAIPSFLASQGMSAQAVGSYIGIVLLPWSLKLISAPVMDRYTFLAMGRRRPWVMAFTFMVAMGYGFMALIHEPLQNFTLFIIASTCASAFTAVMDVAIDGMAIDILKTEEHGKANALMWGSKVVGAAITSAGAGWLLVNSGISATMMVSAIVTLFFFILSTLFIERPGEKIFPWTKGKASAESLHIQPENWKEIFTNLGKVLFLKSSMMLMLVVFFFGITYGLFDALMPIITNQQLNWESTEFSTMSGIAGLISGLTTMFAGGWVIKKMGTIRSMSTFLILMSVVAIPVSLLLGTWPVTALIWGFVIFIYLARSIIFIGEFTASMRISWKKVAATQFAIYMAIGNLGISAGAALLGPLNSFLSLTNIFFAWVVFAMIALLFLRGVKFESADIQPTT